MLGITTSDAIALGSMIAALTAACIGLVRGDRAKDERSARVPPERMPDGLDDLTQAVRALADVLRTSAVLAGRERARDLLHRDDEHR